MISVNRSWGDRRRNGRLTPHQLRISMHCFSRGDVTSYRASIDCRKIPALGGVKLPSLANELFAHLVLPLAPVWCRVRSGHHMGSRPWLPRICLPEGGLGPPASTPPEDDDRSSNTRRIAGAATRRLSTTRIPLHLGRSLFIGLVAMIIRAKRGDHCGEVCNQRPCLATG